MHAGAGAADGLGVGERQRRGPCPVASWCDRDEARHAAALGVGAAHEVARALRGDHDHVDAFGGRDLLEADVEAVGEGEGVALAQVAAR